MSAYIGTYECDNCWALWDGSQIRENEGDMLAGPLCGNEDCPGHVTRVSDLNRTRFLWRNRAESIAEAESRAGQK